MNSIARTLFGSLLFLCTFLPVPARAADAVTSGTLAAEALKAALKQAAADSKNVFLVTGAPWCGWCKRFDQFHALPEVKAILGKHYVVAKIDTDAMPDGRAVYGKYGEVAWPAWVILDPEEKVLVTSDAENGNVGYPFRPEETAHYLQALKLTSPVSQSECEVLSSSLQRVVPPQKRR